VFIFVIAALVQIIEMFLKKAIPSLYRSLGIYLPLITTNCAVLGLATIVTGGNYSFLEAMIYSFASGFGFLFVIFLFSTIRERLNQAPVPKAFVGVPIALITAGLMAMVFARFAGIA
jgi:electron transport complex protein RnfA